MKNLLFFDAGIFVIAVAAAFLEEDFTLIIGIIDFAGLIFIVIAEIVIAEILIGFFLSGNRIRANYTADNEERR